MIIGGRGLILSGQDGGKVRTLFCNYCYYFLFFLLFREGESIKVYIRVRPVESYEDTPSSTCSTCIVVTTPTTITINSKPDPKVFTFDHVASPNATQVRLVQPVYLCLLFTCVIITLCTCTCTCTLIN